MGRCISHFISGAGAGKAGEAPSRANGLDLVVSGLSCSRLQTVGIWMRGDLGWSSFSLWFGLGGQSYSNF